MAYDSDDISDKLKSLKGSSLSDFSQEDLDMMWKEGLTSPAKIGDNWDEQGPRSYSLMYGEDEWKELQNEIDYGVYGNEDRKYGPRAGVQDLFEAMGKGGKIGELTDEQKTWQKASKALGISKVDSLNDIRQLRGAVQREMMGRFAMAGGMAKDDEIAEPATTTESKPVTSETLLNARKRAKEYEEEIRPNLGNIMYGDFEPPKMEGGPKDINSKTGRPNDKTYLDEYKINIADKMTPIKPDGTRSQSKYAKMREERKRQRRENRRQQTNIQIA